MFNWAKNIFKTEEKATATDKSNIQKPLVFERDNIFLADHIKAYYADNGPATVQWLVQQIISDLNNPKVAELFSDYYDGTYSKRDILDQYEEIVTINPDLIYGVAKLGEHFKPELVSNIYEKEDTYKLFSEHFVSNLLDEIANCRTNMKQVEKLIWEEYFYCVKNNLDIKKKSGISCEDVYKPADKIEADLIMLLQADLRARRN